MNWGWHEVHPVSLTQIGEDYNAWYKYNDWDIPELAGINYRYANKMIHDIEP